MEFTPEEHQRHNALLMQTYKAFQYFCQQNNIRYWGAGGTIIGAVRHQGLIPWDDDIDVYMTRSSYDRFLSLRSRLADTDYEIIDPTDDGNFCTMAKFSYRKSTIWEMRDIPFLSGVYIDVFVLDYERGTLAEVQRRRERFVQSANLYCASAIKRSWRAVFLPLFRGKLSQFLWYLFQKTLLQLMRGRITSRISKQWGLDEGEWLVAYTGTSGKRDIFRAEWFDDYVTMPFEDTTIEIMSGYDSFLKAMYGDYMTLPPVEQRVTHHHRYYINLDRRISAAEMKAYRAKH